MSNCPGDQQETGSVQFRKGESMKSLFSLIVVAGLLSLPLMAADYPKAEIFGGYQYLRVNDVFGTGFGFNANGWEASLTGNVNQWLGVTGDFGGVFKSVMGADLHIYTYGVGPPINFNHSTLFNPSLPALFARAHLG